MMKFLKAVVPWKGDPAKEIVRKLLVLLFSAVLICCAVYLASYFIGQTQNKNAVKDLQELYHAAASEPPQGETEDDGDYPEGYLPQFWDLYRINPDIKGWVEIPETVLSYPVVSAKDNDYYLRRDFNREHNQNGVPFMDYRNTIDPLSDNTVIYSHNMKDGQMFNMLISYDKLDFYQRHPVINFDTVYETGQWKIFGVFYANTLPAKGEVFDYHNFITAKDEAGFQSFVDEVKSRSLFDIPVDVEPGDKLLTLSTCAYNFEESRMVIVARRVRDGETSTVDTAAAQENKDAVLPEQLRK